MALPLPPLAAIRAFEAAARLSSFTRAAEELGMTQAAVSYQIKVLEDRVGAPLFLRRPRQVELTETGRRLSPQVSEAFDLLRSAYAAAQGGERGTLVINTLQTFASNWLAKHLGSFQLAHPGLAVRLEITQKIIDFAREETDVAIRAGAGNWPGLISHLLVRADFTAMVSPKLAEGIGGVNEAADLLRLPIVEPDDPWWEQWLTAAGLPGDSLKERTGAYLGSQSAVASAAIAGQGVALLTPAFVAEELADGRLIRPIDLVCSDGEGYWLVYPESRRNAPKVSAFRKWILSEIAAPDGTGAGSSVIKAPPMP